MNQLSKRARLGLVLLAIGAFSALAAPGASAATTAYECGLPFAGPGFSDGHCLKPSMGGGTLKFEHRSIPGPTAITISNKETASSTTAAAPAVLEGTVVGAGFTLKCAKVTGAGSMFNGSIGGEMVVVGEAVLNFSSCTVENPSQCQLTGGQVETELLTGTTAGQGAAIKISPKTATVLTRITLQGCQVTAQNRSYALTGSLKVSPVGATGTTTHAEITTQNTLNLGGAKAGLSASFIVRGEEGGEETFPLVVT